MTEDDVGNSLFEPYFMPLSSFLPNAPMYPSFCCYVDQQQCDGIGPFWAYCEPFNAMVVAIAGIKGRSGSIFAWPEDDLIFYMKRKPKICSQLCLTEQNSYACSFTSKSFNSFFLI